MIRLIGIWIGLFVGVSNAAAGLYSLEEPMLIKVRADGVAEPLEFSATEAGPFRLRMNQIFNWLDSNPKRSNPDRDALIQKLTIGKPAPSPFTQSALLLRLGKSDEALNTLAPLRRSRVPDFRVLANLAHIHAWRGEWPEARRAHEEAILDAEIPPDLLPNIGAAQVQWLKRVEKDYYRKWLRIREQRDQDRVKRLSRPEEEAIFPLFGELRFEIDGRYQPGKISPAEQAILPADAIPIVQQLLLWEPNDTGLYWLLGELYAAMGKPREALAILDNCASESRQYSNRLLLKAHRSVLRDLVEKLPPENQSIDLPLTPTAEEGLPPAAEVMPSRASWIVFGVLFTIIAVLMITLKVRTFLHNRRR